MKRISRGQAAEAKRSSGMDLGRVKEIMDLMEAHGLAEIEVENEDFRICLRKHGAQPASPTAVVPLAAPAVPQAGPSPVTAEQPDNVHPVVAPMVGTFDRAASPEAEPFVDVGDAVGPDTVMCIVEAMKVMNEVRAEVSGTVRRILAEAGKPVEYGQALFLVAQ